jgi:hypothetical protein
MWAHWRWWVAKRALVGGLAFDEIKVAQAAFIDLNKVQSLS